MSPKSKEELDAIRAKSEDERTDEEKEALAAAERTTDDGIDWEKAFNHPRFKELNQRTKKAEEEADRLRREKEESDAAALKEQGKWEELYKAERAKNERLAAAAEKAESYEETLKSTLEAELKALPESSRKLIPSELPIQQQLNYIARNRTLLTKSTAPEDIGSGRRGGRQQSDSVELTSDEKEIARRFGMKEEEYAKFKSEADLEAEA